MRFKKSEDKSNQAGTSFTPSLDGATSTVTNSRPKTAPATNNNSHHSTFPSLLRFTSETPAAPEPEPLITLKLSSPSFLESVVHDDLSANPLYVIETQDNTTKIRRTDTKGLINVSRVRWRENAKSSRRSRELVGIQVAFGKGPWKPAEEFLGYSYGSLLSYRKFYLPHHPHSMRWRRVGSSYYCTTASVKGPVAVLEPAIVTAPPQLRVFDALHKPDASRPQRTHGGVPISLLDFLMVTSMLLVTDADEWTNITRAGPAVVHREDDHSVVDIQHRPSRASSSLSLSSEAVSAAALSASALSASVPENVPSIERWRHNIPQLRPISPDIVRSSSPSSPVHNSRGSQSSDSTDTIATPISPGASSQPFSNHSHSHPLSHSISSSSNYRPRYGAVPLVPPPVPSSRELPMLPRQHSQSYSRHDQPWLYPDSSTSSGASMQGFSPRTLGSSSLRSPASHMSLHSGPHIFGQPSSSRSLPPVPTKPQQEAAATLPSPITPNDGPHHDHYPPSNSHSTVGSTSSTVLRVHPNPQPRPRPSTKAPPNYDASARDNQVPFISVPLTSVSPDGTMDPAAVQAAMRNLNQMALVQDHPEETAAMPRDPPPAYTETDSSRAPVAGSSIGTGTGTGITQGMLRAINMDPEEPES